ncbi:MAG: hypothetical protein WEB30_17840 [Cyclobacteriaceae bacterium]
MKRPLAVTIIAWFFIAAGAAGFLYHLKELNIGAPFSNDASWVLFVRLLATVGGILLLRGSNAGRWLLVSWLAYHVALSYFHTISQLVTHATLLAVIAFALFHPRVAAYFRRPGGKS